jgi:hypothetical protein
MAKNIESPANKLGAAVTGTVADYSAGALGMAALAVTARYFQAAAPRKQNTAVRLTLSMEAVRDALRS